MQWIVDGYLLVFAGLLLTVGRLRRPARPDASGLLIGLASSAPALLLAPFVRTAGGADRSRAFMGLGAAPYADHSVDPAPTSSQPDQRPKAIAHLAVVPGHRDRRRADPRRLAARPLRVAVHPPRQPAVRVVGARRCAATRARVSAIP